MSAEVVWLPFAYRAKLSFADRPRDDRALLRGRLAAAPTELTWDEAPISAAAGDEVFRHRDGVWYRPVRTPDGGLVKTDEISEVAARPPRGFVDWADYPLFGADIGLPVLPFADGVVPEDGLPEGCRVRSSERGLREGYANAAACGLVRMRGVLWRTCPEPFLAVRAERGAVGGRLAVEVTWRHDPQVDAACFRLDELDAAMSHAEAVALAHNKAVPKPPPVEVKRPDVLAFAPDRAMAARIVFEFGAERRRTWLDPKVLARDPDAAQIGRLLGAVDRHSERGDPFPVLAAAGAVLISSGASGRYAALLRDAMFPVMVPQLRRWAAARRDAIATSEAEDEAIAGFAPGR